jgi:hypothetical protein
MRRRPTRPVFRQQAGQENRRHIANCFVAVDQTTQAIGAKRLPKSCRATPRFLPRSSAGWPSIFSIGTTVLARRCCGTLCAARCNPNLPLPSWSSTPRDEQAARFYYRYGFLGIGPGQTRLYIP